MDTTPVVLPVQEDFWKALDRDDFAAAEACIEEALTAGDYCKDGMIEHRSLLHEHIWKYVTGFRTTHDPDSVAFDCTEIYASKLKGTTTVEFHVSAYLGCKDIDIEEDLIAEIDFTIDPEKAIVTVHFAADSLRSSEDAEWAE